MALIPSDHSHSAQDRGNRWRDLTDSVADIPRSTTDEATSTAEVVNARTFVWNTSTLQWDRATAASAGGGGAATIADGADVAQGSTTDVAWVAGNGTVISLLKKIASAGGSAVSIADGADVAEGAVADAIVAAGATGTVSAKLRRLTSDIGTILSTGHPVTLTSTTITGSVAVTGPLTDTQLRATPVPVSGTVTANAGSGPWPVTDNAGSLTVDAPVATPVATRLSDGAAFYNTNTGSQLPAALAAGGGLKIEGVAGGVVVPVSDGAGSLTVDAPVGTPVFVRLSDGAATLIGQKAMAASLPVVIASDQSTVPVSMATQSPDVTDRAARELGRARIWDGTDEATVLPVRTQPATSEKVQVVSQLPARLANYQVVTNEVAPAITLGVKELLALWYTAGTKDIYITEIIVSTLITTASTTAGRTTVRASLITTAPTGGTARTAADLTGAGATAITNAMEVKTGGGTLGTTFIRREWEHATEPLGRKAETIWSASSLTDAIILRGGGSSGISIDVERVAAHTALVDQFTCSVKWIEL